MEFSWSTIPPYKLTVQHTLKGCSVGAYKTAFYIPELGIMLDCGERMQELPDIIFLTHLHTDHCHDSPIMLQEAGRCEQGKVIKFIMHQAAKGPFDAFIRATLGLVGGNHDDDDDDAADYEVQTVLPDTQLALKIKNRDWIIDVVKCFHTPDCVGYGFTEVRQKLKKEYAECTNQEIITLKKAGTNITESIQYSQFVFLGDTRITVFEKSPIVFKFPTIIVECNFILEEDISLAKKTKHICWHELKPIIKEHPNNTFVLIHFSRKHTVTELNELFTREIKNGLTNIVPWIPATKKS